jgi:hypothetical protein
VEVQSCYYFNEFKKEKVERQATPLGEKKTVKNILVRIIKGNKQGLLIKNFTLKLTR